MLRGGSHDEPLVVGMIGLGYWGPNLLRVLSEDPGVIVRWICDRDAERVGRLHRRYPAMQPTLDAARVLADPEVDAVVVATPVATHHALCSAALAAGKHTFVEKPLAPSVATAERLLAQARSAGRVLMCGHTFLYSPPVRAVRRMLDEGVLGELYFASASRVNLGPYRRDVSVLWDLGPHDFSILLHWLGGPPTRIRAIGRAALATDHADIAFVSMTFASGVVASAELSWLAPSKLRRTVLVGSEKMVVYEDGAAEPIRLFDHGIVLGEPTTFGEYQLSYRTGDILSPTIEPCEPLAAELADFARAVREDDPMEANTALARDVVAMLEAADRSLHEDGAPVALMPFAEATAA